MWYLEPVYRGLVPDWLLRLAIRASIRASTRRRYRLSVGERQASKRALIAKLKRESDRHTHRRSQRTAL